MLEYIYTLFTDRCVITQLFGRNNAVVWYFSVIEGLKSTIWNVTNLDVLFLLMSLNQLNAINVSRHWFGFVERLTLFIICSKNIILISLIPFYEGINSLHLAVGLKLSFKVFQYEKSIVFCIAFCSCNRNFFAIVEASLSILPLILSLIWSLMNFFWDPLFTHIHSMFLTNS